MKLMDISTLNALSNALNGIDIGESILYGRVEAYSCKMTGNDRKLQASLEHSIQDQLGSPNAERISVSPFGPLTDRLSRQTLIYLITTLNCAFPYYDFSYVDLGIGNPAPFLGFHFSRARLAKDLAGSGITLQNGFLFGFDAAPEQFHKEISATAVCHQVNSLLSKAPIFTDDMRARMWNAIDTEIQMSDCDVYSFNADSDSDPFNEDGNNVWSFNYFFYNRRLKRILLVTCRAEHKVPEENLLVETTEVSKDYEAWIYDEIDMEQ